MYFVLMYNGAVAAAVVFLKTFRSGPNSKFVYFFPNNRFLEFFGVQPELKYKRTRRVYKHYKLYIIVSPTTSDPVKASCTSSR